MLLQLPPPQRTVAGPADKSYLMHLLLTQTFPRFPDHPVSLLPVREYTEDGRSAPAHERRMRPGHPQLVPHSPQLGMPPENGPLEIVLRVPPGRVGTLFRPPR